MAKMLKDLKETEYKCNSTFTLQPIKWYAVQTVNSGISIKHIIAKVSQNQVKSK